MSRIVISYRRDDSEGWVGRLYDQLILYFGKDQVFRDVDTLEPGARYEDDIEAAIGDADVVLVVIGPNWLTIRDEDGVPRLERENDLHRREVATALRLKHTRVIPVLVQGATMPRDRDLPPDLLDLARRHYYSLSDARWTTDIGTMVQFLARFVDLPEATQPEQIEPLNPLLQGPAVQGSFMATGVSTKDIAEQLSAWIEAQDFDVQLVKSDEDAWTVQARRANRVRVATGFNADLTVALRHDEDVLRVDIRSSRWLDGASGDRRSLLGSLGSLPVVRLAATPAAQQPATLPSRILDETRAAIDRARTARKAVPLRARMLRELREIEQAIGCEAKLNEDSDGFIVSVRYSSSRGQRIELFMSCSPDFPDVPPVVLLAIDNREQSFSSPTLHSWSSNRSLAAIAQEALASS